MNEKASANTNGNEAGNPGGKQERKTRTVEVRVWTSGLGTIIVTPVRGEEAREAVREADGGYDAELVESVQEYTDWTTVLFADCRGGRGRPPKLKLQVFDGDECILKQDSLPTLDAAYLVGYAKALHEHGEVTPDNFDRYEEYNEGEREREAAISIRNVVKVYTIGTQKLRALMASLSPSADPQVLPQLLKRHLQVRLHTWLLLAWQI